MQIKLCKIHLHWWAWLHGPSALSAPACAITTVGQEKESETDVREREREGEYAARRAEVKCIGQWM